MLILTVLYLILNCVFSILFLTIIDNGSQNSATIYLRTPPELCLQRIKQRKRQQEMEFKEFNSEWLTNLHLLHEQWLLPLQQENEAVFIVDGTQPVCDLVRHTITFLKSLS